MANYRMQGDYLYDSQGHMTGRVQGDYIYNGQGGMAGRVQGNYIYDGQGRMIGTLNDARNAITGAMGGITVAALWVAFIR